MTMFNTKKNTAQFIVLSIFFLLAIFLRVNKFSSGQLVGDEILQVNDVYLRFPKFWKWKEVSEFTCFTGDYILNYPFTNLFYGHVWLMRLPHIVINLLGFIPLYLIMKKMFHSWVGFFVTLSIYSFNATLINHSFEIRPYAVLPTFALLSFYFWDKLFFFSNECSRMVKWIWGVFMVMLCWFHAYGLYIAFLPCLYHFLRAMDRFSLKEVWRLHAKYLIIIFLISFVVWFYYALGTHVTYHAQIAADMGVGPFFYFANPLTDFGEFSRNILGNLFGNKFLYLLIIGIFGFALGSKSEIKSKILFFLILIVLAIECVYLPSLLSKYYFIQRQFIWVIPFFAILIGWLWDSVFMLLRNKWIPK